MNAQVLEEKRKAGGGRTEWRQKYSSDRGVAMAKEKIQAKKSKEERKTGLCSSVTAEHACEGSSRHPPAVTCMCPCFK